MEQLRNDENTKAELQEQFNVQEDKLDEYMQKYWKSNK